MNFKNLFLVAALAAIFPGTMFAQTDFFWSFNDLNTGATNSEASAEFSPGNNGSIFLYYSTNGPADSDVSVGAFLDIATSESGIIQFTGAETFDFDITLFGSPLGKRWGDAFGETSAVSDDLIDELSAFTIFSGVGMLESNNGSAGLLDQGYDAGADAFLFGRVDFTVLADPGPAGTTVNLLTSAGFGGIVNMGGTVNATFGSAAIVIADDQMVLGDVNGDGIVDMNDVGPFIQVIISGQYQEVADINADGSVNLLDVRPFVDLLSN